MQVVRACALQRCAGECEGLRNIAARPKFGAFSWASISADLVGLTPFPSWRTEPRSMDPIGMRPEYLGHTTCSRRLFFRTFPQSSAAIVKVLSEQRAELVFSSRVTTFRHFDLRGDWSQVKRVAGPIFHPIRAVWAAIQCGNHEAAVLCFQQTRSEYSLLDYRNQYNQSDSLSFV
jgi:hypothetical protein